MLRIRDKKRSQKTVEIKVFLLYLLDDRRNRIRTDPDPGSPKTHGTLGIRIRNNGTKVG
jgi:hypothetical protein